MNAFALTDLQRGIAEQIAERMGRPVHVGSYTDISDSFHLYGSYFAEFEPELKKMRDDPDYTKRAWRSDHPAALMMFEETREKLRKDPDFMRSR
jgi:thymidylate synthase